MDKIFFRNQVLDALNSMERAQHEKWSSCIAERVIASEEFRNAETIGITLSRFPEIETRNIIESAWQVGKRVAVPKCIHSTREMDFRLIQSYGQLETVYLDLLEPIVGETISIKKEAIDLQIVPGVVFSEEGYRIGFGGGYYDRYLQDYQGSTLSLAFDCQIGYEVPVETHDIPVRKIYTEQREILCAK
ncbi:5-formyltetrahydrofolate cyclo-ligase [Sporosarcina soli]|uniref:5-formyltetrahydrofolate cyclo-ligase n=1 Tax=Sporosarcina soli TaxID=334736 RepID=A0ABW0TPA8_9BACL